MDEMGAAGQIIVQTIEVGNKIIEMPFMILSGGLELVQRIMALIELSRRHKPENGEINADVLYQKYGNQVSVISVPNDVKDDVYKALSDAGVEFSYFPSLDQDNVTSVAVPICQYRTATEALNKLAVDYTGHSLDEYATAAPDITFEQLLDEARKGMDPSGNFIAGDLRTAAIIDDFRSCLDDPEKEVIEIARESVIDERDTTVRVELPDHRLVDIGKRGMFAGDDDSYILFLDKDSPYAVIYADGDKRLIRGDALYNDLYNSTLPPLPENYRKQKYYDMLERAFENHKEAAASAEAPTEAPVETAVQTTAQTTAQAELLSAEPPVQMPMISIDKESLLADEDGERYYVRIPKNFYDHETGERIQTDNGGSYFYLNKSDCTETNNGMTILASVSSNQEFVLYDRDRSPNGVVVTGSELYRNNFDLLKRKPAVPMQQSQHLQSIPIRRQIVPQQPRKV